MLCFLEQILAAGLSPLVSALERCWHEPYVPAETVRMALILYKNWTEVSIMEGDAGIWRMMPLDACVDEIITLVTARLGVLIEAASHTPVSNFVDGNVAGGDDVEVLLTVLSASTGGMGSLSAVRTRVFHPGVIDLRDKCVSLLIRVGETSLPPAAHLLAIASLERVVRAQGRRCGQGDVCTETAVLEYHGVQCIEESLTVATAEGLVLSLVERTVQGRIVSGNGSISQGATDKLRRGTTVSQFVVGKPLKMNGVAATADHVEHFCLLYGTCCLFDADTPPFRLHVMEADSNIIALCV